MWLCDNKVIENRFHNEDIHRYEKETYFPGEPFKKNEYERKNVPKEICTPSVRGDASHIRLYLPLIVTLILVQIILW